jgi:hypothetical protein
MKQTPKAKLENIDRNQTERFKLTVNAKYMEMDREGTVTVMLNRGDVNNLHIDCSQALLDDDIRIGIVAV